MALARSFSPQAGVGMGGSLKSEVRISVTLVRREKMQNKLRASGNRGLRREHRRLEKEN